MPKDSLQGSAYYRGVVLISRLLSTSILQWQTSLLEAAFAVIDIRMKVGQLDRMKAALL